MKELSKYPLALQLLMQTDGTVTELIKLLANEDIKVVKLAEKIRQENEKNILNRRILLQGEKSHKNWLYAESIIYLDNLPKDFVTDLLDKTIPIGTLWINYRIETFKQQINKSQELSTGVEDSGYITGTELLTRIYHVYNQQEIIMKITEKFPVDEYTNIANNI